MHKTDQLTVMVTIWLWKQLIMGQPLRFFPLPLSIKKILKVAQFHLFYWSLYNLYRSENIATEGTNGIQTKQKETDSDQWTFIMTNKAPSDLQGAVH